MKLDKQIIKNWLDNNLLVYLDKLLKKSNLDSGLIEKTHKQIKKAGDYIHGVLGATNKRVIKEDGDFELFIPEGEQQNEGFDRMWCISENGICNQIETNFNYFIHLVNNEEADEHTQNLVKIFRHFGLIKGDKCLLDTAYVASGSGTTRRGNSYDRPADFIRKYGLVPKGSYPVYSNWNGLYYPKNGTYINGNRVPQNLLDIGKQVTEYIDFTYEWVQTRHFNETAPMGALGTSCYAWGYSEGGIYRRVNYARNHAIYKFKKDDKDFKKIGDSYEPFVKNLALNYNLGYGMLISYGVKKNLKNKYEELLEKGTKYIIRADNKGEFYEVTPNGLEYHPKDEIDNVIADDTDLNTNLRELTKQKKVMWVNEAYYSQIK